MEPAPPPTERLLVEAVGARRGGGYRQLGPILSTLSRLAPDLEVEVFTLPQAVATLPTAPNITYRAVKVHPRFSVRRLFLDFVTLPLASRRRGRVVITALNVGPIWLRSPHISYQNDIRFFIDAGLTGRRALKRFWAQRVARAADAVIVPTSSMAREVSKLRDGGVHVIALGADDSIDGAQVSAAKAEPVQRWSEAPGRRLLAVATANSANKDLYTVLGAMRLLIDDGTPAALALTVDGDDPGPDGTPIEAVAERLGIGDSVHFLGYCDRPTVVALYRLADLNISASLVESFGFPLVEAAIESCPSICTNIPPSRELLGEHAIGYFEPGDSRALADLIDRTPAGLRLTPDVVESFRRRFSWDEHARALLSIVAALR